MHTSYITFELQSLIPIFGTKRPIQYNCLTIHAQDRMVDMLQLQFFNSCKTCFEFSYQPLFHKKVDECRLSVFIRNYEKRALCSIIHSKNAVTTKVH